MSSDDVYVVVRLYNGQLQYLTPKDIWSKLAKDAKKFKSQDSALAAMAPDQEVWRMAPVPESPGQYRCIATFNRIDLPARPTKTKKGKK